MTIKSVFCKFYKTKQVTNGQVVTLIGSILTIIFMIFSLLYSFSSTLRLLIPIKNSILLQIISICTVVVIVVCVIAAFVMGVILFVRIMDKISKWMDKPAFECDLKKK